MGHTAVESFEPDADDMVAADAALERVQGYLTRHPEGPQQVRLLLAEDGTELVMPRPVLELLARALTHMAAGHSVSVVPAHTELTTQQAADLLNVSRPFLIGLLDAGKIDYRKVGKHRRVRAASLLRYMRTDDQRRRAAADELAAMTPEMGLD